MPIPAPAHLTTQEAAEYTRLSRAHLYVLARHKEIPHWRVGRALRFDKRDLDLWIGQRTVRVGK